MNKNMVKLFVALMTFGLLSTVGFAQPKNVILFIGDGMGPGQIEAARCYLNAPLSFEGLPNQGKLMTYSASSTITDSAAAATALATGVKVNNGVISMALPGDGSEIETMLEHSKSKGKSVGLVTTVYVTHATPAGFGAHETERGNYEEIGNDYLIQTRPNVLFGGALYLQGLNAQDNGYTVVSNRTELNALATEEVDMISGQFGLTSDAVPYESTGDFGVLPHLSEMTAKALQILDNNEEGFFLMVEGGKIDWACHLNDLEKTVHETIEFSNAVQEAITWAATHPDTLILVTADHETGGLAVITDNGEGKLPTVTWSTTGHTATNVDIFAWGVDSDQISGVMNNTDLFDIAMAIPNTESSLVPAGSIWNYNDSGTDLGTAWRELAFDDSTWASGPAQIGYGEGDENTTLEYGDSTDKYPCYYLRRTFSVSDPAAFGTLEINLLRDDGCIIYINGTEVVRSNMPTDPVSYLTYATVVIGGDDESAWNTFSISPTVLVSGTNIIAVEMHQANAGSTDLSFDLAMTTELNNPPLTPTGLSALGNDGIVSLDWADNVETEDDLVGYDIYRGTAPGVLSFIASVATSAYDDTTVSNGTTYYYAIEAFDQGGLTSALSAEVSATPNQPPSVTLISPADQSTVNAPFATLTCDVSDATGLLSATLYIASGSQTISFSGPTDTEDTYLSLSATDTNYGSNAIVLTDGANPVANSLLRFPTMIGNDLSQIPLGATIESATLEVNCSNVGTTLQAYRLTEDWDEDTATWNNRNASDAWTDAGADGTDSHAATTVSGDFAATGLRTIDLTAFVQDWSNGTANYGIVLINSGNDGVQFDSSEAAIPPRLTVTYRAWLPVETKDISGTTAATVSFTPSLQDAQDYDWNCLVTNTATIQAFAPANFSFRLEAGAPEAPEVVSPLSGTTLEALAATLEVTVQDPGDLPMDVTFFGREKTPDSGAFTIAVLPDTQFYSESYPEIFAAQTQWIADNAVAENIVFVSHEGDLVETASDLSQWSNANSAMTTLDNALIPYGLAPGNHDMNSGDTINYNATFPFTRYESNPWYGGHYASANDSSYQLFSAGGNDYMVMHLQYNPDAATVAWADGIMKANPNRRVIVTTHSYMDATAQTNYLWDDLIATSANVYFVLCGHIHAEARRTDTANGHPVHQMLADYQSRPNGGNGWLRLLRFVPDEDRVYVETYSPWLDQYETDADSAFTLDYTMSGYEEIATVSSVASGSNASITWSNLTADAEYEWFAVATNSLGKSSQSPTCSFTATDPAGPNTPPVALDDTATCDEDDSILIDVLFNDKDPDGDSIVIEWAYQPAYGDITIEANYNITYKPFPDFFGVDSFTYSISDGRGGSDTATVNVTVLNTNDQPIAEDDDISIDEDTSILIAVLANDTDVDGDTLLLGSATQPGNGSVSIEGNQVRYTPAANYNGTDSFSYSIIDGQGGSDLAQVYMTVLPVNDPPVAQDDYSAGTDENTSILIDVLDNDSDPEGDSLSLDTATQPLFGSTTIESNQIRYTPEANQPGSFSFDYTVIDGNGGSDTASVSIIVTEVNDRPAMPTNVVALADDGSVSLAWDTNPDPENDLSGYKVYRSETSGSDFTDVSSIITETIYTDTDVVNGTTYYYQITAIDSVQESLPSTEVQATPGTPNVDAYATAIDPTLGTVTGDLSDITSSGGGAQTITEVDNGKTGASSLDVTYTLHADGDTASVTFLQIVMDIEWTNLDNDDPLVVLVLNTTSGDWEDITSSAIIGSWTATVPSDYVDGSGNIKVRFQDTAAIRKEEKDTLNVDHLLALFKAGPATPDTMPPSIYNIAISDLTYTSVRITWDTGEPADSSVNFGTTTALGTIESDESKTLTHSIILSDLQPGTTYHFTVISKDAALNKTTSAVDSFDTPIPTLIYVGTLDISIIMPHNKATATATATVLEYLSDAPIQGATVIGDWYLKGALIASGSTGTTDEDGDATITSPEKIVKSGDEFQFTITDVTLPDGLYDAEASQTTKTVDVP